MNEQIFTRDQVEDVIKKSVIMTKDLLSDKHMSGLELYNTFRETFNSFILPDKKEILEDKKELVSYYPSWLKKTAKYPWDDKVAKKMIKGITKLQKTILKIIIKNNNSISFNDLKKQMIASGVTWKSDFTLYGSLSGLSQKCVHRYNIPYIYTWDEDKETYSIVPEALQYIKEYLK